MMGEDRAVAKVIACVSPASEGPSRADGKRRRWGSRSGQGTLPAAPAAPAQNRRRKPVRGDIRSSLSLGQQQIPTGRSDSRARAETLGRRLLAPQLGHGPRGAHPDPRQRRRTGCTAVPRTQALPGLLVTTRRNPAARSRRSHPYGHRDTRSGAAPPLARYRAAGALRTLPAKRSSTFLFKSRHRAFRHDNLLKIPTPLHRARTCSHVTFTTTSSTRTRSHLRLQATVVPRALPRFRRRHDAPREGWGVWALPRRGATGWNRTYVCPAAPNAFAHGWSVRPPARCLPTGVWSSSEGGRSPLRLRGVKGARGEPPGHSSTHGCHRHSRGGSEQPTLAHPRPHTPTRCRNAPRHPGLCPRGTGLFAPRNPLPQREHHPRTRGSVPTPLRRVAALETGRAKPSEKSAQPLHQPPGRCWGINYPSAARAAGRARGREIQARRQRTPGISPSPPCSQRHSWCPP